MANQEIQEIIVPLTSCMEKIFARSRPDLLVALVEIVRPLRGE